MSGRDEAALRRADARAREAARTRFDVPIVLEAGAGTGKTATLVARIATWCLDAGWKKESARLLSERGKAAAEDTAAAVLGRLVALTFTERAAAEMEERVARAFGALLHGKDVDGLGAESLGLAPQELRVRSAALLSALDRLFVGTIHAFCKKLLASYSTDAGLHPAFEVDPEGEAIRRVCEEVLTAWLPEAARGGEESDVLALAEKGRGPEELLEALVTLAQGAVPAEAIPEEPYGKEAVAEAAAALAGRVDAVLALTEAPLEHGAANKLKAALRTVDALRGLSRELAHQRTDTSGIEGLSNSIDGFWDENVLERLSKWGKGEFTANEAACFEGAALRVSEACAALRDRLKELRDLDAVVFPAACRVLRPFLEKVHAVLRERGIESFAAMLRHAATLLRERSEVRARVRGGIDQIFVDEFQDTDPLQYEILEFLALDGDPEGRPGLFLIGDPKQSIYAWREADLEAYERFLKRLERVGGEKHVLSVNFRSVPAILQEVERAAAPVMQAEPGVQPPFEPLLASEGNLGAEGFTEAGRRPVEYWVSWREAEEEGAKCGPETRAEEARELEARAVARELRELHGAGKISWRDAAILIRASTQQDVYLEKLRDAGVPFVVERDKNYYQRREVIDAAALVRAVLDPNDQIALVAALRSPLVGVPDGAWLPLWREGFPEKMARLYGADEAALADLGACIARAAAAFSELGLPAAKALAGWERSLIHAVRSVAALRRSFATEEADEFLEKLRALFLPEELASARVLGLHRAANLDRFFRKLMEDLFSLDGGAPELLHRLRRGVSEEWEEAEASPGDETLDAVRVLTVHKAKGLTFDQVYLVGLHGESGGRGAESPTQAIRDAAGWHLRLLGVPGLSFAAAKARRVRAAAAEQVRALYVAMTRPRRRLVLAGKWNAKGAPPPLSKAKSAVDLLARRAGAPDLEQAFSEIEHGREHIDACGVRWLFPPWGGEPRGEGASGKVPDARAARAEWEALKKSHEAARLIQERPFTGTASTAASHERAREAKDGEETRLNAVPAFRQEAALLTGTLVHRVLEEFDLARPWREELARQRARVEGYLSAENADSEVRTTARESTEEVLDRLEKNALLEKLSAISPAIIGRELPLLLAPRSDKDPAGAVVGTIDLLYRDGGEVVVADFKTDRVSGPEEFGEKAAFYREQGRVYVDAVRRVFGEQNPVRFELWLLRAGEIVPVEGV